MEEITGFRAQVVLKRYPLRTQHEQPCKSRADGSGWICCRKHCHAGLHVATYLRYNTEWAAGDEPYTTINGQASVQLFK